MFYKTKVLIQPDRETPDSLVEVDMVIDLSKVLYIQSYIETEKDTPLKFRRNSWVYFDDKNKGLPIRDTLEQILPYWEQARKTVTAISPLYSEEKQPSI